jgi:hypothetical protein
MVYFRNVPGGVYQVSAMLKGEGGDELAFANDDITIVESGAALR